MRFQLNAIDDFSLPVPWSAPRKTRQQAIRIMITVAFLGFICFLFSFFLHRHHLVSDLVNKSGI
jgi:hypothetical protein